MHVRIFNWNQYRSWDCCKNDHLKAMDRAIDTDGWELVRAFPGRQTVFTRECRCIINGWQVCK
jgi:hypothetical protein